MDANFLSAEPLFIDRLKTKLGDQVKFVGTMADMQEIEEHAQVTPALYVVFDGYTPGQRTVEGRAQEYNQRWLVVAAVRNVSNPHTGQATREDAGAILGALMPVLQAWKPSPTHGRLTAVAPPGAVYRTGFAYIPTAWELSIVTHYHRSEQ